MTTYHEIIYRACLPLHVENYYRIRALQQAREGHDQVLAATGRKDAAQAEFVAILLDHCFGPDEITPEEKDGYLV